MTTTAQSVLLSLGMVNMWGFSPGFDMLNGVPGLKTSTEVPPKTTEAVPEDPNEDEGIDTEPINILLIGPGDVRHALATIAHRKRYGARPLHIYIYEKSIETLARHLLLLQITQDWQLPLRQRCNLFLEVFGNSRVQKAKILIDMLHNERGLIADQFDLSHLKMRDRDELIDTFRSWFQSVRFDVDKLRDHRLRHYYEVRYDHRNSLIDWDYTMSLRKIENASVIHIKQYREWRNSGIAFEFGDQTCTVPNRTMAAYTEVCWVDWARKKHHGSVLCRGLWTDIIIGPFISFGVQSDSLHPFAKQLFEIHNKGTGVEQNRHRFTVRGCFTSPNIRVQNTVEVAVFNILSYLHEMETAEIYTMKKAHDVYSGIGESELDQGCVSESQPSEAASLSTIVELGVDDDEQTDDSNQSPEEKSSQSDLFKQRAKESAARQRAQTIYETFDGVKIFPLTGELGDLYTKKRYARKFDHLFVSTQHTHTLQDTDEAKCFSNLLADNAAVSIESSVFLLPLKEDQRVLYASKLLEMAQAHSLKPAFQFINKTPTKEDLSQIDASVLQFSFSRSSTS